MLRIDQETLDCDIVYGKDSQENTVSILWLIPQYTIITIGEVLNSATAGEFVYTQIWLLSQFIGTFDWVLDVAQKLANQIIEKVFIRHQNQ